MLAYPTVDDCALIELPRIPDVRGSLSFVEGARHIAFPIARTYWVYDVPGDAARPGHAHRELEEVVIALSGSFEVRLDDGSRQRVVRLNRSYRGVHVPRMIWRAFSDFSTNSVCLVLASRHFAEDDYIRDYARFVAARNA
ncbi:MAG TPA: FdtA/QdtA family cupin domain-containing protein [Thermoanaerobaculia bacterium]